MQHVDGDTANFEHIRGGNLPRPGFAVHIAANGSDWPNLSQLAEDFATADVTSVNDVVRSAQGGKGFGTKQTVSIGNNPDDRTRLL